MRRLGSIGCLMLVSFAGIAAATPASKALSDAAALSKKGDHAKAARVIAKAVEAEPKNAQLLSELGWQWFLAKNLPNALANTNRAIAAADSPALKAASLYNLGRIDEELGKRPEAADAYAESLKNRENETVLRRLAAVDPKRAAEVDPARPTLLDGPFPSIDAWCATITDGKCDASLKSASDFIAGTHNVSELHAPYLSVRTFVVWRDADSTGGDCAVAIQLASGWYAKRAVEYCRDGTMFRRPETNSLEVTELPAAQGPVLAWTLQVNISARDDHMEWFDKEPELHEVICGIGHSGKPSCGEPYSRGPIAFP